MRRKQTGNSLTASLVVLTALLVLPAPARGEDLARWQFVATVRVDGNAAGGQLAEFELTDETFAHCRRDLGDFRLTDAAGKTVPYVIRSTAPAGRADNPPAQPIRLLDCIRQPGKNTTVTADFGRTLAKNQVEIVTAGKNFLRCVTVEGSTDGNAWRKLRRSDRLLSVGHEDGVYAKSTVDLPEGSDRYLRVTVFAGDGEESEPTVESIGVRHVDPEPRPDYVEVPLAPEAFSIWAKDHIAYMDVDLGVEKLPLRQVAFPVTAAWCLRRVEMRGRDHETISMQGPSGVEEIEEPWRSLGGGIVYRLDSSADGPHGASPPTNRRIDLADGCRHVRLIVTSPPADPDRLAMAELGWPTFHRARCYVAFQASGPGPYRLYMGNARAASPEYDLTAKLESLRAEPVATARMDSVDPNPTYAAPAETTKETPFAEKHRTTIWTAMVLLALAAIVMIRRQMRKARQTFRPPREQDFHNL